MMRKTVRLFGMAMWLALLPACNPECVDRFDCKEVARTAGKAFTCVDSKCVQCDAAGCPSEAGGH